ncbi:MAG TPA: sugar ABC transporter permease [Pseudolysinimonas sp.]|jgi:alpha-glucoside transport system permease protein|nr:sugar ABC transporter permease [Pseudolysinimonas sp.]
MKDLLTWLGTLPPLAQIPIIVVLFLIAATVLVLLIEVAPRPGRRYTIIRFIACLAIPGIIFLLLGSVWWAVAVAVVLGGGFFLLDYRSREGKGYLFALLGFLAPAIALLIVGLVYPTIATIYNSLLSNRGAFIGLENFAWVFSQPQNLVVIRNTIIWVLVVPAFSTAIGLAYAVFIDKSRGEKFFKILVFMPMAISFVGASIIWRFVYAFRPEGEDQIGILNGLVVLFGGSPVNWLQQVPLNSFLLMVVLIWVQTGFAMVVLSASIKGVPIEQVEAAQLDGTNAWQRFWNVTIPSIRPSLIVVLTTISIASLKVFDIVRTMGLAYPDTGVIANEMVTLLQKFEAGRSSAFAVILFLLVLPIVIYNARQIQKSREIR